MANFHPHLGMILTIGAERYSFLPHPLFADENDDVYAIEGGEAIVYHMQRLSTGERYALKVHKLSYRGEHTALAAQALQPYTHIPGLALSDRICLTSAAYSHLIATYPDLEYAVIMPWLPGRTWAGFLADREAGERYTSAQAFALAFSTARVLWELEAHHLAHCDIAGGNIMLLPHASNVELLDIENLYMPQRKAPHYRCLGSPGYQHRRLDANGQWRPEGDRFAGAIALTEMLTWCDPLVRASTPDGADTLFQPHELQEVGDPHWEHVRDALWQICPPALGLFDQAWASYDLAECPELSAWALCLLAASPALASDVPLTLDAPGPGA